MRSAPRYLNPDYSLESSSEQSHSRRQLYRKKPVVLCKRNITPFSTAARLFLDLLAQFAEVSRLIHTNHAFFKPG
jgi:hypothetical protein